jgi:hypothetical protein
MRSRYASAVSPSSSSPSSLRMASSCRRRRCSRCCWSSPSRTSWLIFSVSSRSASASLAHPSTRRTRSVTSIASSSCTLRSVVRSGHQPTRSARPPGSSGPTERRMPRTRRSPSSSNSAARVARSSPPSALASSVGGCSSIGSAVTHRPAPVPTTPAPSRARPVARTTRARVPPGRTPVDSTVATAPTVANRSPIRGTSSRSRPSSAAAAAALASSDSALTVTTMPGSTTPSGRGRAGRVLGSSDWDTWPPSYLRCASVNLRRSQAIPTAAVTSVTAPFSRSRRRRRP